MITPKTKIVYRNGFELQVSIDPLSRWRFKGGSPKAPKAPAPTPTPERIDPEVEQKERDRRRQRLRAAGRAGTILTQPSGSGETATLLGRSTL